MTKKKQKKAPQNTKDNRTLMMTMNLRCQSALSHLVEDIECATEILSHQKVYNKTMMYLSSALVKAKDLENKLDILTSNAMLFERFYNYAVTETAKEDVGNDD